MTPKERREKLFHGKKPYIRPIQDSDLRWMYGAYKYPDPPGDQEDFDAFSQGLLDRLSGYQLVFIAEDRNRNYKSGWGPVAVFPSMYNGWTVEPHVQWFPWATNGNKVRVITAFLMFCRYNSEFGCTEIRALENDKKFFKRLKKYSPIYYINKLPGGDPRGDLHLFYVRGRKSGKELCLS